MMGCLMAGLLLGLAEALALISSIPASRWRSISLLPPGAAGAPARLFSRG